MNLTVSVNEDCHVSAKYVSLTLSDLKLYDKRWYKYLLCINLEISAKRN